MQAAELANSVEALLMAVKSTNDFEAELDKKFRGRPSGEDLDEEVRRLLLPFSLSSSLAMLQVSILVGVILLQLANASRKTLLPLSKGSSNWLKSIYVSAPGVSPCPLALCPLS